jgi:hypothetical protein
MEVFSYGKKKNNEDFVIVFKIMCGNLSDIKARVTLTFELVTKNKSHRRAGGNVRLYTFSKSKQRNV